jgi:polyphosphate kinase
LKLRRLIVSPFSLNKTLHQLIEKEIDVCNAGRQGHILIKVNALTDANLIIALYKASQAGVKIDLIVRGICCLKPQLTGISDHIRVISIVGRFLEHTRVYYFANDEAPRVFLSSSDLMERSLFHRVETCFPVLNKDLASRIKEEGLSLFLSDNIDAWELDSDGQYQLISNNDPARCAQQILLDKHKTSDGL